MENNTLLSIKNLKVEYRTEGEAAHAVNGVDLTIKEGETFGLVGETGAGKTTTALSILKLLPSMNRVSFLSADELRLGDIVIVNAPEGEMRNIRGSLMSMIFQDPMTSLNPMIKIGKQIAEAIELHEDLNAAEVDAKVDEMLKMVGISADRKNEYPHQFSGGMKQRVLIAIALACNPKLLIADEPTTALDVTIQAQVLDMMTELKEKLNTSMLLITHDLGIVAETCDRVGVMYAGEIIEEGPVEDIFEGDVHHPYTVGLFGSIPDMEHETERLSPIPGLMPDPYNLPEGCKFSLRCPYATEECKKNAPPVHTFGAHSIRCFYPEKKAAKEEENV